MAKADKKTRGRTSIGKPSKLENPNPTHPNVKQVQMTEVNRGQSAGGGGKHRGDRRDMNKTYTGNTRHAARGNTPRANVATRKD
ncbi:MAG: hypothetical protein JWN40_393 [Phycisphaerales bacterium]|nr:hypothetical protein [Phycisphaerales bacterium]